MLFFALTIFFSGSFTPVRADGSQTEAPQEINLVHTILSAINTNHHSYPQLFSQNSLTCIAMASKRFIPQKSTCLINEKLKNPAHIRHSIELAWKCLRPEARHKYSVNSPHNSSYGTFNLSTLRALENSYENEEQAKKMEAYDLKNIFGMLTIESGFHVDAISPTKASGISQLTGPAIEDVNLNLNNIINSLPTSCSQIKDQLLKIKMSAHFGCHRMESPFKNIFYGVAYQNIAQKRLRRLILTPQIKNKFEKLFPNHWAQEELISDLSVWTHNTGYGGIVQPFLRALQYFNTAPTHSEFKQKIKFYIKQQNNTESNSWRRKNEKATYFEKIVAAKAILNPSENSLGCTQPGSSPSPDSTALDSSF